ncbi:MAG: nickel-responsive transcriptional regulator NikR [Actinobacteria bacterium]|nr:nickel-responsive transcriptional regulator NikR [Actinomycetota bacterium]
MSELVRFGVSIDEHLLDRFDELIAEKSYVSRSEALRDLIRGALIEDRWEAGDAEASGTVTLVYDHHSHDLSDRLTERQHSHHEEVVSTLHVHLDARHCLEVIVLRGVARDLKRIADGLIGTKGVKHGRFVATTTGELD